MNTQIIAIANQKGGVGKTTTCANLGIGLAQAGKKVLLIDGDPQGSLTISLGNPQPDKLPFTLSDAMGKILMDQPIRPGEGILHHAEGVDLMPADIQLSGMEVSLVNAMSRETILRQYLDTLKGQYSHILIDCQPSLGMLTVNALAAANRIIIPICFFSIFPYSIPCILRRVLIVSADSHIPRFSHSSIQPRIPLATKTTV